jgi:hypothetical protein
MNRHFFFAILVSLNLAAIFSGCAGSPAADTGAKTDSGAAEVPAGASSYYVRADGYDRNDGLSEDTPF